MILTLYDSVMQAYTTKDNIIESDWETISEVLMTHIPAKTKEEVKLFNLWHLGKSNELGRRYRYKDGVKTDGFDEIPNTIRRSKSNAYGVWGLVLDVDEQMTIEQALTDYSYFEFVLYTTFRNTDEHNKFRVVMPFKEMCDRETFERKKKSLAETFKVDHASFSESQSFYLHSGAVPIACRNKGIYIDIENFEDEVKEVFVPKEVKDYTNLDNTEYKQNLIDSLVTCSGLHYASQSRYGVLTLVALCKSADIDFSEYDTICWGMAAPDSSLQNAQLRKSAWQSWKPFSGITAKVRDEFISNYGGISKFKKSAVKAATNNIYKKAKERKRNLQNEQGN